MAQKRAGETLKETAARYRRADRSEKGRILDEFCRLHGYERKYAIKMLKWRIPGVKSEGKGKRGRPALYGPEEMRALKTIWLASGQMCSKRFKSALPLWLPFHEARNGALPVHFTLHPFVLRREGGTHRLFINILPMPEPNDNDHEPVVQNLIDHPVVANPDPAEVL